MPVDLYHDRGDWKAQSMAFKVVGVLIRYCSSRHCRTQKPDALLHLTSKGEVNKTLDNEGPVLTVSQAFLACAPQPKLTHFSVVKEPKGQFNPFIKKVCMMAGIMDNKKADIPVLTEFPSEQFNDVDCPSTFASV